MSVCEWQKVALTHLNISGTRVILIRTSLNFFLINYPSIAMYCKFSNLGIALTIVPSMTFQFFFVLRIVLESADVTSRFDQFLQAL